MTNVNDDPGLTIGVLVDPLPLGAWVHEILTQIAEQNLARTSFVAVAKTRVNLLKRTARLPLTFYLWLDRLVFPSHPFALEHPEAAPLLRRLGISQYLMVSDVSPEVIEAVDIVLNLSSRPVDFAEAKEIWSVPSVLEGKRCGVAAVYEKSPVVSAQLRTTAPDSIVARSLCTAHCATDFFSVGRSRNRVLWKAAALVVRTLKGLRGSRDILAEQTTHEAGKDEADIRRSVLFLVAKISGRLLRDGLNKLFYRSQWQLIYSAGDYSDNFAGYRRLSPPKDRIWADPCVVMHMERHFVFVEQVLAHDTNGQLAVLEIDNQGIVSGPKVVLEKPYHLSHPFVFAWGGDFYLVPESAANRTVDLYRCVEFPMRWEHHKTLLANMQAVDATLLEEEGCWWMFVTVASHEGATTRDELFLYSSQTPVDEWRPHPLNPVVTDVRRARPAGRIFRENGRLMRPAQDCSHRYGYGIRLMEIEVLNGERYEEKEADCYQPNWDRSVVAMHTIDRGVDFTVLDTKRSRLRLWE